MPRAREVQQINNNNNNNKTKAETKKQKTKQNKKAETKKNVSAEFRSPDLTRVRSAFCREEACGGWSELIESTFLI